VALSNLATRVLVALVAIPLVLVAAYAGSLLLALLLALASALAAWELYRIGAASGDRPLAAIGIVLALLVPVAVHFFRLGLFHPPYVVLAVIIALALLAAAIWLRGVEGRPLAAAGVTLFGVVYTGGALSFAYGLRHHNYVVDARSGTALLFYPLVLTWISDSAGYFVGRALGRHKLIPSVSPGKTVEGALGALVLTMLASWAYARGVLPSFANLTLLPWAALLFGAAISVAVQLGDLAESLIKREAGVKDSSHLIPGHGGVLDRIDGLLFALPTAYLVFTFPHVLIFIIR
jgi:phosphatidate cytidylyltransferase